MCACACDCVDKSVPNELVYWRKCNERKKTEENGKKVVVSLEGCCLLAAQLANWVELNNSSNIGSSIFFFLCYTHSHNIYRRSSIDFCFVWLRKVGLTLSRIIFSYLLISIFTFFPFFDN